MIKVKQDYESGDLSKEQKRYMVNYVWIKRDFRKKRKGAEVKLLETK